MISRSFAEEFARSWIEAWNGHDLAKVLAHYAEDFEMASPYIAVIAGEASGVLRGKAAVGAYWARALEKMPSLHFDLTEVLVGVESVVLHYRGVSGPAAETFFFGADGKVIRACAHYA